MKEFGIVALVGCLVRSYLGVVHWAFAIIAYRNRLADWMSPSSEQVLLYGCMTLMISVVDKPWTPPIVWDNL